MTRKSGAFLGLFAIAAMATAVPVSAEEESMPSTGVFKTSQQLSDMCNSEEDADLDGCYYFLMGAYDMMKFYGDVDLGGAKICAPDNVTADLVRKAVLDYWSKHPGTMKLSASSSVYNALVEGFPCKA